MAMSHLDPRLRIDQKMSPGGLRSIWLRNLSRRHICPLQTTQTPTQAANTISPSLSQTHNLGIPVLELRRWESSPVDPANRPPCHQVASSGLPRSEPRPLSEIKAGRHLQQIRHIHTQKKTSKPLPLLLARTPFLAPIRAHPLSKQIFRDMLSPPALSSPSHSLGSTPFLSPTAGQNRRVFHATPQQHIQHERSTSTLTRTTTRRCRKHRARAQRDEAQVPFGNNIYQG
ncbi:hypothetical protein QBC39DRAFT_352992 [Podospora conica]|nr:hypothetical protein QBC39DRAFT_352992 [Schizothecium conicum]